MKSLSIRQVVCRFGRKLSRKNWETCRTKCNPHAAPLSWSLVTGSWFTRKTFTSTSGTGSTGLRSVFLHMISSSSRFVQSIVCYWTLAAVSIENQASGLESCGHCRTEMSSYRAGRMMEYTWHIIFGEKPMMESFPECELLYCDDDAMA